MGCCGVRAKNDLTQNAYEREEFIAEFFNKNLNFKEEDKRTGVFIKQLNKKMKISKSAINVELEIIVTLVNDNPNTFSDKFWVLLDCKVNELKSKIIYVDDIQVDDSSFEIEESNIKIPYEKLFNGQTRKIRIIEEIEKEFSNYAFQRLILNGQNVPVRFLIYGVDGIKIDDISNKNYIFKEELNLAYYEGKTTSETTNTHGYINYSKITMFQIYKYIPEFEKKEKEIITIKENNNKNRAINILAVYKKVIFTEYGQSIDEIVKMKLSHYEPGEFSSTFSYGLMLDTEIEVDAVELNGRKTKFNQENASIVFQDFGALNNQYGEIHMKYRYLTNKDKNILRQESVIVTNTKNTYCKIIVEIPDNYVVLSHKEIFQKDPKTSNKYFYKAISEEEQLKELFKFCFKKGTWNIEQEFILQAKNNISQCTFIMNRIHKGGNYKELEFQVINENGEFIDNENEDQFIFKYKDLSTNTTTIRFKVKVENSTAGYKFIEKKELITQVPKEEEEFFKKLSNTIIKEDKSNIPIYKKLGKWVFNYLKYDIKYYGKQMTAKEIYNIKSGVCKHFTLLYNSLLVSQGIEAISVGGYALEMTENNIMKENEISKVIKSKPNSLESSRHCWTLAKIDGEWIPLDATWNMFNKNVPISHIYQNYGENRTTINSLSTNTVEYTCTKEIVKFIKK